MMPSDWIRPDGCEGGACVEYRTVDGKVFVRNSTDEDHMVAFTVAEWDAFVAGLTAEVTADLADEQIRLRQRVEEVEGMVALLQRGRDGLRAALRKSLHANGDLRDLRIELQKQRNEAVAEAAVLRHRDRRTQAVVEAAVALRAADVAGTPWPVWRDAKRAYGVAVDAYVKGPTEAPASPLPAEQPPVEALATDGAGAQGEAQGAGETFREAVVRIRRDVDRIWAATYGDAAPRVWNVGDPEPRGVTAVTDTDGSPWHRGADGTWWCGTYPEVPNHGNVWEHALKWAPLTEVLPEPAPATADDVTDIRPPGFVLFADTIPRDQRAMIAKTLADGIRADGEQWLAAALGQPRAAEPAPKPDGEGAEAGRAGEAQEDLTAKAHRITSLIDAGLGNVTQPDQERTEGLDAAIEAAKRAARFIPGDRLHWLRPGRTPTAADVNAWIAPKIEAALRAASPLIERAALLAVEQAILNEPRPSVVDTLGIVLAARVVRDLAARAGRTVAS